MAHNPPPNFHASDSPQSTFVEHKKPKFSFPETPKAKGQSPLRPRPQGTPATRALPTFTISPRLPPAKLANRARPTFDKEPPRDSDEIYLGNDIDKQHIHNPFDVSEELEEEITQPVNKRRGPPRFITDAQHGHRPRSAGTSRTTTDILSSIRFGGNTSRAQNDGDTAVLSADWSPHKKKLKQGEHLKFTKGGMAETVALWIYEAQCGEK